MLHVTYVMFPGVHLLFVFFCELSFSILHAYFCMILTNVFFIPCNRYVWNSLDHLPHVFIYVDACLGHQFCLWHGICIYIFKLLLPLQFGDLGIVRFSNVLVRYLRVVQQVEPYDLFLKNLKSDKMFGKLLRYMGLLHCEVSKQTIDEAMQLQAHDRLMFLCFGFFSQSTWL